MGFAYVFMMQAAFSVLINWASLKVSLNTDDSTSKLTTLDYVGALIFAIGFLMEAISDNQLQTFRDLPNKPKGSIITSGLWKYSRHPNYFGEALLWWGLYLITCGVKNGFLTFFSPLIITLLLRYVSGVPLLEKHFKNNVKFQEYAKVTSIFIPMLPGKVKK
jgi:steroid 5-alpha reductase family enzyme